MIDAVTAVTLALLVGAVVASVVPGVPSGLLALVGVYTEYLFGPGRMGLWLLLSFTVVGILTIVVDLFGGAITGRAKGASTTTTLLAAAVGLVLLFVLGPLGVLLGMFGTVFLSELRRDDRDTEAALDNALWATLGMLASGAAVFLLSASMLAGYVVFALWL
ncbi:DUF456 domain-containing protein [Halolamina sediminis]|uniref:DUF456 domain-containing protein n=1 Tax=Halolamina sediminis TaxID=1480675 RepID=UPI0006B59E95|nr:DUF456 domain-containing protein [Halolamina sediminis]